MKTSVILLLAILLTTETTAGTPTGFMLAGFDVFSGAIISTRIYENQIVPINKTFGLDADLTNFESSKSTTGFQVKLNIDISTAQKNGFDYSVIRDGVKLNKVSDTVQVGDLIRFKPKFEVIEQDWIAQGGNVDSPPITLIEDREKYYRSYQEAGKKFGSSYPCASAWGKGCYLSPDVPVFSTKTTDFTETNPYTAENGYPAYIVPMINGKKAGLQVICNVQPSWAATYGFNCKQVQSAVECTALDPGMGTIDLGGSLDCYVVVDKIIEGKKAIQANWMNTLGHSSCSGGLCKSLLAFNLYPKNFQVMPKNKKAPVAEFYCKRTEDQGLLECSGSASHDPNGTIQKYRWQLEPRFL